MNEKIVKIAKVIVPKAVLNKYWERKRKVKMYRAKNMPENEYEEYLSNFYKKYTSYNMDFACPKTFTQKAQWLKLYDQDPKKTLYSDKYAVREMVRNTIGEKYLIPLISINGKDHFYSPDEIDFSKLPKSFVLKCNHGCGYNIIVKDKKTIDIKSVRKQLNTWLAENYAYINGLELVYRDIKPCIIIEKYIAINDDLPDYKFMCFSGEIKYVWCDQGRFTNHRRTVFDPEYNPQTFTMGKFAPLLELEEPENYYEMLQVVKKLCMDFTYVRVDLYNVEGRVYFGELTFSSGSGIEMPYSVEYDEILGSQIVLDSNKRIKNTKYRKI